MVLINTFVAGTDALALQVNQNFQGVMWNQVIPSGANRFHSILPHSTTTMSACITTGGVFSTANTGATWTSQDAAPDVDVFSRLCKADLTKGFVVERAGNYECSYTANSGTAWNPTAASPAFGTALHDVSFPTSAWIVIGGNDAAAGTDHIIYSVDQGTNWVNAATSPGAAIVALDCYSGSEGYAITAAGAIWECKAGTGANTWVDTTHTYTGGDENSAMVAVDETTVVIGLLTGGEFIIETYDNAGNATEVMRVGDMAYCLGCVADSNGVIYTGCRSGTIGRNGFLFRSRDSGATWESIMIPLNAVPTIAQKTQKCCLSIDASDNLYLVMAEQRIIMKFDGIST